MTTAQPVLGPEPRSPWWAPFRRPWTWIAILGFALLSGVVASLGMPEPWNAIVFGGLLAAAVAVVTGSRSPWAPLAVFLAVLGTRAALWLGGLPAFLGFEAALLLVVFVIWMRRRAPTHR